MLSKYLTKIFNVIFVLVFGYIIFNTIFNNNTSLYTYNPIWILVGVALYATLAILLYKWLSKKENINEKIVVPIILVGLFLIQLVVGYIFRVNPSWDFGVIADSASNFFSSIGNSEYFFEYPNNLGLTYILKSIFLIFHKLGVDNTNAIGIIINIVAIDLAIICSYLVARKIFGKGKAIVLLILLSLTTPLIFYAPIYYTDTLSMLFPILTLYLYLLAKDNKESKKKYLYYILMGISTYIGVTIKFTVVIVLIAIIIYELINKNIKESAITSAVTVGTLVLFMLLQNFAMAVTNKTDEVTADRYNFPLTHWVMMGLTGNGGYNYEEVEYTRGFESKAEKEKANIDMIKKRLSDKVKDNTLISFMTDKIVYTWGDGTYYAPEKLRRLPVEKGPYHDYVLGGEKSKPYFYFSQIQQVTMLLLLLIASLKSSKKEVNSLSFILRVTLFGVMMFFMFWEARSRYIVNFIPIIIITSFIGLEYICNKFSKKTEMKALNEQTIY